MKRLTALFLAVVFVCMCAVTVGCQPKGIDVTITFDALDGSAPQAIHGNTADFATPTPKNDYAKFAGWYLDKEFTMPLVLSEVQGDITVYAKWTDTTNVKVTYNLNYGVEEPVVVTVVKGFPFTLLDNPDRTGYTFKGWFTSKAATSTTQFTSNIVTSNTTLYAGWELEPNHVHTWGTAEVVAPTCTEQGYDLYTCVICGETRGKLHRTFGTFGRLFRRCRRVFPYDSLCP